MVADPVAFSLGRLAVRWYGILIMLGVLAGAYLASRLARRKGENADHLWNMVPLVVFAAIAEEHAAGALVADLARERGDAGVAPGGAVGRPAGRPEHLLMGREVGVRVVHLEQGELVRACGHAILQPDRASRVRDAGQLSGAPAGTPTWVTLREG